jgi:hypothetical protein
MTVKGPESLKEMNHVPETLVKSNAFILFIDH